MCCLVELVMGIGDRINSVIPGRGKTGVESKLKYGPGYYTPPHVFFRALKAKKGLKNIL